MRGMIPRAVEQVFSAASSLTEKGWQVTSYKVTSLDFVCLSVCLSKGWQDIGSYTPNLFPRPTMPASISVCLSVCLQYTMEASFLEIYNETIRDLLTSGNSDAKLEIKINPNNASDVYVTNLTPVVVTSETQVIRNHMGSSFRGELQINPRMHTCTHESLHTY